MQEGQKIIRARNVLEKAGIVTIDGMATAHEAAAVMRERRISSLIVDKRHGDDAWGIIVVQDLIRGVLIPGRNFKQVNVYEIMSKPVMTVPADMDIRYVASLLQMVGARRAPVEECGNLIGMISLTSLVLDNDLF